MEQLDSSRAKRLILKVLESGTVRISSHAREELQKDNVTVVRCYDALRVGWVEEPELEKGTCRYRVQTRTICVVVAFRSEASLVIVTAWRKEQR